MTSWLSSYPAGRQAGLALLREMHDSWPFFKAMMSNMVSHERTMRSLDNYCDFTWADLPNHTTSFTAVFLYHRPFIVCLAAQSMVLSKTDLAIAYRYAELVPDAHVRNTVYGALQVSRHAT